MGICLNNPYIQRIIFCRDPPGDNNVIVINLDKKFEEKNSDNKYKKEENKDDIKNQKNKIKILIIIK